MKIDLILLAAGNSKRFGSNKLLVDIEGEPMYKHMAKLYLKARLNKRIVVSQYKDILEYMKSLGFITVYNDRADLGKSHSIALGMKQLDKDTPIDNQHGIMFAVCDQPYLTLATIDKIIAGYGKADKALVSVRYKERLGNPCIFSYKWYDELCSLHDEEGGKTVIKRHIKELYYVDIDDNKELFDIDTYCSYINSINEK